MTTATIIRSSLERKPILIVIAVAILVVGVTEADFLSSQQKNVVVQNWDNTTFDMRCFSFDESKDVHSMKPKDRYLLTFWQDPLFPMTTMWNCSTDMGTFIAFKDDYECNGSGNITCNWRFDRKMTYLYSSSLKKWIPIEFNPNYESLDRGGVLKGSNKLLWK